MKIYQHNSQWLIEIHGGAVLFHEHGGHRDAIAMAWNISQLVEHGKTLPPIGGYYIADHGTYCIDNAAVAEAMAEVYQRERERKRA